MQKIHIFSPHIDDALLSLGGCVLNWSLEKKVKVINIFTLSEWTHNDSLSGKIYEPNVEVVSRIRKTEEYESAKYVNYDYEFWDFLDYPLRKHFSQDDEKNMRDKILNKIMECLNEDDLFFFPLGLDHPDHILINQVSNSFSGNKYKIYFYEDLPYFSWGKFDYQEAYSLHYQSKRPISQIIDFENKASVISNYSSQISEQFLRTMRAYSYNLKDNQYYERYWKSI